MFLLVGFEYWGPVYMKNNLQSNSLMITIAFTVCMAVATILGALTAGFVGDEAGGYKDRRALVICFGVYLIMMGAAFVALFSLNQYVFVVAFFVMIFTENFVEPIVLGIMLTLVKPHEREVANSISLFLQMGLGYIPAPYVYGAIQDATKMDVCICDPDMATCVSPPANIDLTQCMNAQKGWMLVNQSHWGLRALVFSSLIGALALILAIIFRKADEVDIQSKAQFHDQVLGGEEDANKKWARSSKKKQHDIGTEADTQSIETGQR